MKQVFYKKVAFLMVVGALASGAQAQVPQDDESLEPVEQSTAQSAQPLPGPDPITFPHAAVKAAIEPRLRPFMQFGLMPTYAFRAHPDDRSHGLGAQLYGHFWIWKDVAFQVQSFGMAFNDPNGLDTSLSLFGGASTLLYTIEEGGFTAQFGAGPVVATSVENNANGELAILPWLGTVFQFGVGTDLGTATRVELSARCPLFVFGKGTPNELMSLADINAQSSLFPFQVAMGVGLVIEPWKIIGGIQSGQDPFELLFPSF